jgi:hypothetical protein
MLLNEQFATDAPEQIHSNIAKLCHIFPGRSKPSPSLALNMPNLNVTRLPKHQHECLDFNDWLYISSSSDRQQYQKGISSGQLADAHKPCF